MKKNLIILLALALGLPMWIKAQDIKVTRFEQNYTSLIARMNPAYDNTGEACAVLRVYVRGNGYEIVPNLGLVKDTMLSGEIRMWVPQGTRRLTVRKKGLKPLLGYEIPIRVETKTDYDVDIETVGPPPPSDNHVYIGAGYNIMSLSGPSLTVGANLQHHQIELGAVYGLNKSDDLYFYDANDNLKEGYNYNAIRASLTYGYEIPVSDFFFITPMAGVSYLAYIGNEASSSSKSTNYKYANSLSATGGLRLAIGFGEQFRLCITPEYHVAVYKDKNCKLFSSNDDNMKNWNTGFNLNVGLLVYF
jgi:hypothetical protein